MAVRMKLGRFVDNHYGMRVVQSGGDIEALGFSTLVFDSDMPVLRMVQEGTLTLPSNSNYVSATIIDQGFVPYVICGMYCTANVNMRYWGPYQGTSGWTSNGDFPDAGSIMPIVGQGMETTVMPRAMMPFVYLDDRNHPDAGNPRLGGFEMEVRQTSVRARRWGRVPSSGSYAVKYYVFATELS